jgi:hypothetical protein
LKNKDAVKETVSKVTANVKIVNGQPSHLNACADVSRVKKVTIAVLNEKIIAITLHLLLPLLWSFIFITPFCLKLE